MLVSVAPGLVCATFPQRGSNLVGCESEIAPLIRLEQVPVDRLQPVDRAGVELATEIRPLLEAGEGQDRAVIWSTNTAQIAEPVVASFTEEIAPGNSTRASTTTHRDVVLPCDHRTPALRHEPRRRERNLTGRRPPRPLGRAGAHCSSAPVVALTIAMRARALPFTEVNVPRRASGFPRSAAE